MGNQSTFKGTQDYYRIANGGERCMPYLDSPWSVEHLHRYAIAESLCEGKLVLDIASGEGYGSNILARAATKVTGVDISAEAVSHAKSTYKKSNLTFIEGRAEQIPLQDNAVDMIVSFETIEHLVDQSQVLREFKRVLRPDGIVVVSTPDRINYPDERLVEGATEEQKKNPHHLKELGIQEFRELVAASFQNVTLFGQRLVAGSLIVPEAASSGYIEVSGDFEQLSRATGMTTPIFHICLASDDHLPQLSLSFLDGWKLLIAEPNHRLGGFETSQSYRLGRSLTWPLRKLKSLSGQRK